MKKKNLKPIDVDVHLKYRCPDKKCNYDHWISLKEAQTKNFKMVCDCGNIFKPKQIVKLNICYITDNKVTPTLSPKPLVATQTIPSSLQNQCVKILCGYGFTSQESLSMTTKAFEKHPVTHAGLLIKYILQNLGELNVNN